MQIREAILAAASQIEGHPHSFHFMATGKPNGCGSPGCALAWISYFAGVEDRENHYFASCLPLLNSQWTDNVSPFIERDSRSDIAFYNRMDAFSNFEGDWRHNARECAAILRLYADKYHPAVYPAIPEAVKEIFHAAEPLQRPASPDSLVAERAERSRTCTAL